jgi:hypothetical protein
VAIKVAADELARLQHLAGLVQKEREHLEATTQRLFAQQWTAQDLPTLVQDIDFSERIDAFVARFGRLQDLLGDKLLPAWLKAMQEPPAPVLDNLNKAEKFGLLPNADQWLALRRLRNQLVHEYLQNEDELFDALQAARAGVPVLSQVAKALAQKVEAIRAH